MKAERLTDGAGIASSPQSYYFEGITFQIFSGKEGLITLVGKKSSVTLVTIHIHRYRKTFYVFRAEGASLSIEHLYVIERLFQSYFLTFGFSIVQVLLPLYGSLGLKNEVEYSGDLESFPSVSP